MGGALRRTVEAKGQNHSPFGLSSGAASHLVERKAVDGGHEITSWPLSEISITPTPAEWRTSCGAIKSLEDEGEVNDFDANGELKSFIDDEGELDSEVEEELKASRGWQTQPRDDNGQWTDGAGKLNAGHVSTVLHSEGIHDAAAHLEIQEKIKAGVIKTREEALKHIDTFHAAKGTSPETVHYKGLELSGHHVGVVHAVALNHLRNGAGTPSEREQRIVDSIHGFGHDYNAAVIDGDKKEAMSSAEHKIGRERALVQHRMEMGRGNAPQEMRPASELKRPIALKHPRLSAARKALDEAGFEDVEIEAKYNESQSRGDDGRWDGGGGASGGRRIGDQRAGVFHRPHAATAIHNSADTRAGLHEGGIYAPRRRATDKVPSDAPKLAKGETSKILSQNGHGSNSVIASIVKEAVKEGHIGSAASLRTILKEAGEGPRAGTVEHLHAAINRHSDGAKADGKFRSVFLGARKSFDDFEDELPDTFAVESDETAPEEAMASGATDAHGVTEGDEAKSLDADLWAAQMRNQVGLFELDLMGLSAIPHTA